MHFALLAFLPAVLASPTQQHARNAGPDGHLVKIEDIAFAGSGCPADSVAAQYSSDMTLLTLLYSSFVTQAGAGVAATEYRKNCQSNIKLTYPPGWQYSVFKADFRGYASVPDGATATCKATYYFSGKSQQTSSTLTIPGPYHDNYLKGDKMAVETTVWSPCGKEGMLNINSEVRLNLPDPTLKAQMTVDSTDLKFTQLHYLAWQPCNETSDASS